MSPLTLSHHPPTRTDLKHLLIEAKQRIPPFLMALEDPTEGLYGYQRAAGVKEGCTVCGGLGHRVADCPKYLMQKNKQLGAVRVGMNDRGGF